MSDVPAFTVAITDCEHETIDPELSVLSPHGIAVQRLNCRTEDDVIEQCAGADALIIQYVSITGRLMDALPRLKLVSRYGIGVDMIDAVAATQRGVLVTNVPDFCVEEVANQAMAFLLAFARKVPLIDRAVRSGRAVQDGIWNTIPVSKPIRRLSTQTLGIVGLGRIGQRVAIRAAACGLRVLAVDPAIDAAQMAAVGATKVEDLDEMLPRPDYLSLHVPLMETTRHLIDARRLALLKPEAIVINTSRGPVIDETALVAALQAGRLAGAGIDVYEREPIGPEHPLCRMDNVVLSSHSAWYSEESLLDVKIRAAQASADLVQGRIPQYVVNPDVLAVENARWRSTG
jgi:D-3-phosphoglycerate dehydrogenase